jgi:hypothetical protein
MRLTEAQIRRIVVEALEQSVVVKVDRLVSSLAGTLRMATEKVLINDPNLLRKCVNLIRQEKQEQYEEFLAIISDTCNRVIPIEMNLMTRKAVKICSILAGEQLDENDSGWLDTDSYDEGGEERGGFSGRTHTFRDLVEGLFTQFFAECAGGMHDEYDTSPRDALAEADRNELFKLLVGRQFVQSWFKNWQSIHAPLRQIANLEKTKKLMQGVLDQDDQGIEPDDEDR